MALKETAKETKKASKAYVVIAPFQDSREYMTGSTPQHYAVGDDVSHFPQDRLDKVVSLGLVQAPAAD